jgi:Ni,Fe-hydrogenase maturation factor
MIQEQRDYGPQPIAALMEKHNLKAHDLVAASTEQITHKMVARACKGRKLSRHVQFKLVNALNAAAQENYTLKDCFTY